MRRQFRQVAQAATGAWLRWTKRGEKNRRGFYENMTGLRILTFHETPASYFDRFKCAAECALERYAAASPNDVNLLMQGCMPQQPEDTVLFTFDDGYRGNFYAARWLADQGVRAIFFVVPSFFDRSRFEYLKYHRVHGVQAYDFCHNCYIEPPRGLARSQVKEMHAMGHRIGAHNYAHRDLGRLRSPVDLDYEVGRSIDELSELLGAPCQDFAFAFGQPQHVSVEAARYLSQRCKRVYAAVRGMNVPGKTPPLFLTRNTIQPERPLSFTIASMQGGLDHRSRAQLTTLNARFTAASCTGTLQPIASAV